MKDPAFLWYPNDYIGGTMGMTFEQKGAYIELLMAQFNIGHMTSHMVGQILGQNNENLWKILQNKFKIDDNGCYFNERLEVEQNKRKMYSDSRKNNLSGKNQYSKKQPQKQPKKQLGHMTYHMEIVNEIINRDVSLKDFKETFLCWMDYKKDRKESYKSESSIMAALNKLIDLSGNNPVIAKKIVNQSMANNWAGLFELPKQQKNKNGITELDTRFVPDHNDPRNQNQKF
jgi:uncharacterized protein YdaU (DUF1376 family)